jgi:hypothetical protein
MYAANCTRPDIAQAVNALTCVSADPAQESVASLKRLQLRYVSSILSLGITYTSQLPEDAKGVVRLGCVQCYMYS